MLSLASDRPASDPTRAIAPYLATGCGGSSIGRRQLPAIATDWMMTNDHIAAGTMTIRNADVNGRTLGQIICCATLTGRQRGGGLLSM